MSSAYPVPCFSSVSLVLLTFLAPALPATARAESPLATPKGNVILSVSGNVGTSNAGGRTDFDMAVLQSMPLAGFTTTTTWSDGEKRFTGVPVKTLLDSPGAKGTTVSASALNEYVVNTPYETLGDDAPIIAYAIDGAGFSRRDKGPLWTLYPDDADPTYRTEAISDSSIWQLRSLTVSD